LTSRKWKKDRLSNSVERVTETGCWLWMGYCDKNGYGRVTLGRKNAQAHRHSYSEFVGPIPKDMYVCHRCDVPSCINPDHLFLGTQKQNMLDRDKKGRVASGERNGKTWLTEAQVKMIRHLYFAERRKQNEIARHFGALPQTVWSIVHERNWANVNH
jgi:hypothetical protein